jgi:hypothetical protein
MANLQRIASALPVRGLGFQRVGRGKIGPSER